MHINSTIARQLDIELPSPIQAFAPDWPGAERLSIHIKRDDLIHPVVSGNKWRKLSGVFSDPTSLPREVVSFGGGFSNHLHALGYCCNKLKIPMTALVRGDYTKQPTPMLSDLARWGMRIQYVTKREYNRRHDNDYINALHQTYPAATIIPEGGSQQLALAGVQQILRETPQGYDVVMCPVASGATLAGLITALRPEQQAIGIAVLKGVGYLESLVEQFLPDDYRRDWCIEHHFHHGGYAKSSESLSAFIETTQAQYQIPLEPVYSGKLFFALKALIAHNYFVKGTKILVLHTGGLQGARNTVISDHQNV